MLDINETLRVSGFGKLVKIINECPTNLNLTDIGHLELLKKKTNAILKLYQEVEQLTKIEKILIATDDKSLVFILLVLKIVKSRLIVNNIDTELKISIVFAVYKEHNRILSQNEHPHGEDFLLRKADQLDFLLENNSKITWEMFVVDDGCPEGSGKIAQQIINKNNLSEQVKVLFLEEAIKNRLPEIGNIQSTADSQKGGSIVLGMMKAAKPRSNTGHIIIYTDADLSTHLGQIGLLLDPIINQDKNAAIGSRREPTSVVIKQGVRNNRGKLFIYLWKRLLPDLGYIVDTQCGFKAFKKEVVNIVARDLIEKKFAFDIELLLKTELLNRNSIEKVPIAWIDSEAASTTTDIQPYLSMLKSIAAMYRKYLQPNTVSDEFAGFIESLTEEEFSQMVDNIPKAILSREPFEFSDFAGVSVFDLKKTILNAETQSRG